MFRRILVCTDLSPASDVLVECGGELKSVGMDEVILAHVINVATTLGFKETLSEEERSILERQKETLESQGVKVVVEMPSGLPAQTLADTAEKHDVSAILIGSHGKGILKAATLGSVSEQLINQTRRPILLARITPLQGKRSHVACGKLFSNILFPSDFSEVAERALEYVGQLAADIKSRVTLLHVNEEKDLNAETRQSLEDEAHFLAEAKKDRLKSRGAPEVNVRLVFGNPAQEIMDQATKGGFSLIVMGRQGKGFVKEVFLGSVSKSVVRHADLPVLVIPAQHEIKL